MIQSIVAATVHERPQLGPGQAWKALNDVLSDNIRQRMGQEEHATLSLLRYEASGRFTFAGAHEDLLVYKRATGRCERIATPGIWVGIGKDIPAEATEEREYRLDPGDLIVLYTDGIIEATDASGEGYGTERLVQLVEQNGQLAVARICELVMEDVQRWMHVQHDDLTLLVVRHEGS
jgi:phosphoserine phosphatase RsbU/P